MPENNTERSYAGESSPYAPIRYQNTSFWNLAMTFARQGIVKANGNYNPGLYDYIHDQIIQKDIAVFDQMISKSGQKMTKEERVETLAASAYRILFLRTWLPPLAQFIAGGRQIFDMGDELTNMLQNTDLAECTLRDLALPFESFFIRFKAQEEEGEKRIPYASQFDGAFIVRDTMESKPGDGEEVRQVLHIMLTMENEGKRSLIYPGVYFRFYPQHFDLTIQEAIQKSIEESEREFEEMSASVSDPFNKEFLAFQLDGLSYSRALILKFMPLIVNAIFYIESLSELPRQQAGQGTPASLSRQWEQSQGNRRQKVQSRMSAEGYTVVRLLGSEFSPKPAMGNLIEADGDTHVKTHWRRGFWREQAHGPKMSLRSRKWIRPTMVNANLNPDGDLSGHIYIPQRQSR